jgi:hypothetical protein
VLVHRRQRLDGLQLDDHALFDDQIDPVPEIDRQSVVHHGKDLLGLDTQPAAMQLVREAEPVGPFEADPRVVVGVWRICRFSGHNPRLEQS